MPEPLVPAEPPAAIEPSWRQILAMQVPPVNDFAPRAPGARAPVAAPAPEAHAEWAGTGQVTTQDTTIGTLGDEPMGGLPHEASPLQELRSSDPTELHAPALMPRERPSTASRVGEELLAWLKTLASAAVYATLIVTFGFQVARVEG